MNGGSLMSENAATLISHVDTNVVTRAQLMDIPTPEGTETFKPIPHVLLINSLEAVLSSKGISITREQFAIRSDGSKLFGTFDLSLEALGMGCGALGFRTANNRTMKIQLVAGLRVFVCDNMALTGDMVILNRKHTSGLDLLPELIEAVGKYQVRYDRMLSEVSSLQSVNLSDNEAKGFIHDAFMQEIMPIRFLPNVSDAYFKPTITDFEPRTAWSLHNAFSNVAKEMHLNRRMEAIQKLGGLFGMGNPSPAEEEVIDIPQ